MHDVWQRRSWLITMLAAGLALGGSGCGRDPGVPIPGDSPDVDVDGDLGNEDDLGGVADLGDYRLPNEEWGWAPDFGDWFEGGPTEEGSEPEEEDLREVWREGYGHVIFKINWDDGTGEGFAETGFGGLDTYHCVVAGSPDCEDESLFPKVLYADQGSVDADADERGVERVVIEFYLHNDYTDVKLRLARGGLASTVVTLDGEVLAEVQGADLVYEDDAEYGAFDLLLSEALEAGPHTLELSLSDESELASHDWDAVILFGRKVLVVGSDCAEAERTSEPHDDIQPALEEAYPGDTVLVCDGTYGGFTVETDDVQIISQASHVDRGDATVIDLGGAEGDAVRILADGVVFKGFQVTGAGGDGIYVDGNDNTLAHCSAIRNAGNGITIHSGTGNLVHHCLAGANYHGIVLEEAAYENAVHNSDSRANLFDGMRLLGRDNDLHQNASCNHLTFDYHLTATSWDNVLHHNIGLAGGDGFEQNEVHQHDGSLVNGCPEIDPVE
jgi:hypothetical protein